MISFKVYSEFDFDEAIQTYHEKHDVINVIEFMKKYGHDIDKIYVHFCEGDHLIEEYPAEYFISGDLKLPSFIPEHVASEIFDVLPQRVAECSLGDGQDVDMIVYGGSFPGMHEMSDHQLMEYYMDYSGIYDEEEIENDELAKKLIHYKKSYEAQQVIDEAIDEPIQE